MQHTLRLSFATDDETSNKAVPWGPVQGPPLPEMEAQVHVMKMMEDLQRRTQWETALGLQSARGAHHSSADHAPEALLVSSKEHHHNVAITLTDAGWHYQ